MQDKIVILPSRKPSQTEQAFKSNLPAQLTPLIGREKEVQKACAFLRLPEVRLLTLTGTGGIGKTRLGFAVAAELIDDFADGVFFVSLAPISDHEHVISAITKSLGLWEAADQLLLEQLKVYVQDRQLLLLLDNFEHVVAAAPLLIELLKACPKLKMLVTSRAVLHVSGEHEFPVPPLALPVLEQLQECEALSQYAAVALFLQRAKAIKLDFQMTDTNARTIAAICVRLEGLPLAIELAAARIKLLSPQVLLARLDRRLQLLAGGAQDLPARQQTLRNTIQWSYDLLNKEEQRLFRRLSVFVSGCTLEAAETIYDMLGDEAGLVLDGAVSLLDKSMLQQVEQENNETRLVMLETIHEFGLENLAISEEKEATRQAHATYYLSMLEKAWQNTLSAEQWRWYTHLEKEHDNLRAALLWSVEQGGVMGAETVLRLSLALFRFWQMSGHVSEGRRWLERALVRSSESVTLGRARGLLSAGAMAFMQDDYDRAEGLLGQSQFLYRKLADAAGIGMALKNLGQVALARGNYALASSLTEEALAHFREARDKWSTFGTTVTNGSEASEEWLMLMTVLALDTLVRVAIAQGESARARSLAEESLALSRLVDDRRNVAISLIHQALLSFSRREQEVAHSLGRESLAISREIHYQWGLTFSLGLLGLIALQQSDETGAYALFAESLVIRKQVEDQWSIRWGFFCLGWVVFAGWDRVAVRVMYEKLLKVLRQLDDTEFLATCLEGLGSVVASQAAIESLECESRAVNQSWKDVTHWVVRLWGRAEAFRGASSRPLLPNQNPAFERTLTAVRAQLGDEAFAALWAEGRTMMPEEIIAALQQAEMQQSAPSAKPSVTYPAGLTAREVEVLRLLAQGMTNPQIAERLIISIHTVNAHVRSIFNKLDVNSRSALTRCAIERNLL